METEPGPSSDDCSGVGDSTRKRPLDAVDGHDNEDEADEEFRLHDRVLNTNKRTKILPTQSAPPEARKAIGFFNLAGELRNAIYDLALVCPQPVNLDFVKVADEIILARREGYQRKFPLRPGILLLNKATLAEAGPILYSNLFSFDDPFAVHGFLSGLSTTTKAWIRRIHICNSGTCGGYLTPAFHSLIDVKNLQRLYLSGYMSSNLDDDTNAKRIFIHARRWLEAVGHEEGSKTAGVDLLLVGRPSVFDKDKVYVHLRDEGIRNALRKIRLGSTP